MYVDPEFAYLFLVTALETISSVVYKEYEPENEGEFVVSHPKTYRIEPLSLNNSLLTISSPICTPSLVGKD